MNKPTYSFPNRLLLLFILLWFVRLAITVTFFIIESSTAEVPLRELISSQLWQTGELLWFYLLFYAADKWNSMRPVVSTLLFILVLTMILWAIADPIVVSLAGDHLTPALLAHFAGPQIFLSDELWLPIKANYPLVLGGLILMAVFIYAIFKMVRTAHKQNIKFETSSFIKIGSLATLLLVVPYLMESRFLIYPPEVVFVRNALGLDLYVPSETDIESFQEWLSDEEESLPENTQYPLLTKLAENEIEDTKPNIILLVVESFRAKESRLYNPNHGTLELPGHESFARQGLVFPYFISNGFPSTEGFTALSMGIWPHGKDRIVISHKNKNLPCVTCLLNQQGYETYRIEDYPDMEEEGYWIRPTFDHHITFVDREILPSTKNMMNELKQIMDKHDDGSKPFYVHLKTRNPHYPYEITDEENNRFYTIGTPRENYFASMKLIDRHILDLHQWLQTNGLMDNTVVVITGDHANYLDKGHLTSLPTDETVWTGALISGPETIIGKADTVMEHASQVDIPTTLLSLAGATSDWVLFGRDLRKRKALEETFSVAVRPSGIRLDHGGKTYILNRSHPSRFIEPNSFWNIKADSLKKEPPLSPLELLNMIDTWTYLIEQNRVYPKLEPGE